MFNDFNHAKICQVPKNPNDGFLWIIAPELDAENDHNVHTGLGAVSKFETPSLPILHFLSAAMFSH